MNIAMQKNNTEKWNSFDQPPWLCVKWFSSLYSLKKWFASQQFDAEELQSAVKDSLGAHAAEFYRGICKLLKRYASA